MIPDAWTTATPMPAPARYRQASGEDSQGRIYNFGGGNATVGIPNVDRYDPVAGTWSSLAPLPVPYQNFEAAYDPVGNKFYLPGGYNGAHNTTCQVYDVAANTWGTCAALPAARSPMTEYFSVGGQGRIYIFGGNPGPTNEVRYLDIATNTWSAPQAPMPTSRTYGSAVRVGNYIYVIGGASAAQVADCARYDPNANSWAACPPMGTGADEPARHLVQCGWRGLRIRGSGRGERRLVQRLCDDGAAEHQHQHLERGGGHGAGPAGGGRVWLREQHLLPAGRHERGAVSAHQPCLHRSGRHVWRPGPRSDPHPHADRPNIHASTYRHADCDNRRHLVRPVR
jgi:hypothetical protein